MAKSKKAKSKTKAEMRLEALRGSGPKTKAELAMEKKRGTKGKA